MILGAGFFARDTALVAQELLGMILVHCHLGAHAAGMIIETEAYLSDDPACHAAKGITRRNQQMFGPPGRAYVYLIYGIYHCLNTVTREDGIGEAVLIRSLLPLSGIDYMQDRRGAHVPLKRLASGPGNLCRAMGITMQHNGMPLQAPSLFVTDTVADINAHNQYAVTEKEKKKSIINTTRIGISRGKDLLLRFYLDEFREYVSRS